MENSGGNGRDSRLSFCQNPRDNIADLTISYIAVTIPKNLCFG